MTNTHFAEQLIVINLKKSVEEMYSKRYVIKEIQNDINNTEILMSHHNKLTSMSNSIDIVSQQLSTPGLSKDTCLTFVSMDLLKVNFEKFHSDMHHLFLYFFFNIKFVCVLAYD